MYIKFNSKLLRKWTALRHIPKFDLVKGHEVALSFLWGFFEINYKIP